MLGSGLIFSLLLVCLMLVITRRGGMLAAPNERSSHSEPTPTLGGLPIIGLPLIYLLYVALVQPQSEHSVFALSSFHTIAGWWLLALLSLTVVGLWDDLRELSSLLRLLVQCAAAAVVLWSLQMPLAAWLWALMLLAMVWFVNLFNFMDGIDGIAGAQLLVFGLGAQVLAGGVPGWSGDLLWLTTGATLGFLAFNWPPAKIFMGDVGSQPLGLLLCGLVLYLWQQNFLPLVGSMILLAGFWFDATYTLCVRMLTGQAYTQAHRSHLYQRLAQGRGHLWTTMVYLVFSACWLVPAAYLAVRQNGYGEVSVFGVDASAWWWLLVAVAPIAVLCVYHKAGVRLPEQD